MSAAAILDLAGGCAAAAMAAALASQVVSARWYLPALLVAAVFCAVTYGLAIIGGVLT